MSGSGRTYRVLFADALPEEGLAPLRADGQFELVVKPGLKGEELARAIEGMDAVVVRSATRITRDALKYAERLKVIGRAGVGVDNIDVQAATERGIAVLNAPAGNTISAAELAFALLLSLARQVPAADVSMKQGAWNRKAFQGNELYGKTLGLVGAGRIGGQVARRARAFGMRVIAADPFLTAEKAFELDIELASLEEVLRRADMVSLHVPLTESTAGLIGAAQLDMMKPGAYLVNAARGGVVDEAALVQALEGGHLAGAALDVYASEPLPADSPLRGTRGLILTPHVGAQTSEAQQNVAVEIGQAVRAALLESDFTRAVNAPAIGGEEMRRLRPLLDLAERVGRLAASLVDGPSRAVEVQYAGDSPEEALRPVLAAALVGLLANVVGEWGINAVNALHVAEARGIELRRSRLGPHADYREYLQLTVAHRRGETVVAGALLAEAHPRIVRIGAYPVAVLPSGTLVLLHNRDVPGVIGRVGGVLGGAGVNIAEYYQSRLQEGGEALAALRVDGRVPQEVEDALRRLRDVLDVTQVDLG